MQPTGRSTPRDPIFYPDEQKAKGNTSSGKSAHFFDLVMSNRTTGI
jgi:hypothetical protein